MSTPRSPSEAPPPGLAVDDSPTHPVAAHFARLRTARRAHDRPAARPRVLTRRGRFARRRSRSAALVTMVHNEPVFLPLFLRLYGGTFSSRDIYVLDNGTTDGSTSGGGFQRVRAEHDEVDHAWMVRRTEELQHELLRSYELVLVVDVDEVVAPSPRLGDLGDYLERFGEAWVNCLGYELLHRPDLEPPIDLGRPILEQRGWWWHNGGYDKAALSSEPLRWRPGFHGREDFEYNLDPDLRLVHLHRMDHDICLERHRVRDRKPWAPRDAELGWAAHNRIVEEQEFARWFGADSSVEGFEMRVEPVPEIWRGAF